MCISFTLICKDTHFMLRTKKFNKKLIGIHAYRYVFSHTKKFYFITCVEQPNPPYPQKPT